MTSLMERVIEYEIKKTNNEKPSINKEKERKKYIFFSQK
jgi:hypothetical protein